MISPLLLVPCSSWEDDMKRRIWRNNNQKKNKNKKIGATCDLRLRSLWKTAAEKMVRAGPAKRMAEAAPAQLSKTPAG